MKFKRILGFLAIPLILVLLYVGLRFGYINPMIKGLDIRIYGGTFITNLNKYVIKVGDKVGLSTGNYIVVPAFSKKPNLKFIVLDRNGVLEVKNNTLIAKKVGYSSIGILNKNRVLKKATIMVVNPTITNMEINLSNPIKYYGDEAKIVSNVQIEDYKKLEKGYKLSYKSSNPDILNVEKNIVKAVGIGDVKLISRYDRKEIQTNFKILPRIDSVDIDKLYELEKEQTLQLNPIVNTSPKGQKIDVKYEVLGKADKEFKNYLYDENKKVEQTYNGTKISNGIEINKNGFLTANRVGRYLVKVSAGNRYNLTTIKVKRPSFKNIIIKNLQYIIHEKGNKLNVELGWDYNNSVNRYRIYLKDKDGDFRLIDTVRKAIPNKNNGNRVSYVLTLDKMFNYDYGVYVVGYNGLEETKKSNTVSIDEGNNTKNKNIFVKNVKYKIDRENSTILFTWDKIENCTYRIYQKNTTSYGDEYILLKNNIQSNSSIINISKDKVDADFYIVGVDSSGEVLDFGKAIYIKNSFSD